MAAPDPDPFERTGQTLPVSPERRNARRTVGCLFLVIILALLLWFGITHTGTGQDRDFLGWEPQLLEYASTKPPLEPSGLRTGGLLLIYSEYRGSSVMIDRLGERVPLS